MLRERACVAQRVGLQELGVLLTNLVALGMRPVGAGLELGKQLVCMWWRAFSGSGDVISEWGSRGVAKKEGMGSLSQASQMINREGEEKYFCFKDGLGKVSRGDTFLVVGVLCARELGKFTVKVGPVKG